MNKKVSFSFILFSVLCASIFAHGANDIDEQDVDNLRSWNQSFDINTKKAGKYNIMVTASDLGGNQMIEGPYNLYIDPKSDIPVCGITNPYPQMRVQGNLNIVGTCVDDDAVDHVDLILDGDEEHPVRASGKEFWSYYLDTNELSEGPHTIKVVGFDINGIIGNSDSVTWQLDRRQPVSAVNNHEMGVLVSNTVKFRGLVTDGNGIKTLAYSIDSGKSFKEVKLARKKEGTEFNIAIDTEKLPDGPAVLWLKAQDFTGSVGVYSFLYFIDNTKPDVKIITPEEKAEQFGLITIAGYAKDDIGVKSVLWEFGTESGEFELIPGNPYWGITFDVANTTEKSRKFAVTATDTAGNVVKIIRDIPFNEELDKPVVTIDFPTSETFFETSDEVFVRGSVFDVDGVKSVKYKIDNGEWIEEQTPNVFSGHVANGSELSAGKHTITVIATDRHDVVSNPYTVTFGARGSIPEFTEGKIGTKTITNGMKVYQEAGQPFTITANSSLGLESVHFEARWGRNGLLEKDFTPNGALSQPISVSVDEFAQGVVKLFAVAKDTAGRTRNYRALIHVMSTSELRSAETKIVFSNPAIEADGMIAGNPEFPITGFLVGGKAKSVELVPKSKYVTVKLEGNSILLTPTDVEGVSEAFVVRVTTDKGIVCDSRKLIITNGYSAPVVKIKDTDGRNAINVVDGVATVSGTVSTSGLLESLSYKIYGARASIVEGVLTGVTPIAVNSAEEKPLTPGKAFSFTEQLDYGIYVIEVTAQNSGGLRSSDAIAFRNLPYFPKNAKGSPKAPIITWIDAEEVYYVAAYQGTLSRTYGYFKRNSMAEGTSTITASVTAGEKTYSSKLNVTKSKEINAHFALIDDQPFADGKIVELNRGESKTLTVYVDTILPGISANYEITGEALPGGMEKQSGAAVVTKGEGNRYSVTIPISNLPVRMNSVKLTVKSGSVAKDFYTSIGTIRAPAENAVHDADGVLLAERSSSVFDKDSGSYVMTLNDVIDFYPNITGLSWTAEMVSPSDGLEFSYDDTIVSIKAVKDGIYPNVAVRVRDSNKTTYVSPAIRIIVDSGAPEVHISSPEIHSWTKNTVRITGTAADPNGVKAGDYSIDEGKTWKPLSMTFTERGGIGATFTATVDYSGIEDGLAKLDVRVFDVAGNVSYDHTAFFKDTTPPQAQILVPSADDVVNGENLIVFNVTDNGFFEKAFYVAPPTDKGGKQRHEIEHESFAILTHVGSTERPIDDSMEFQFVDAGGNTGTVESWQFIIDAQSDLPISEIHLPTDNEVITRDFTISGVVLDDDGPSTIYYRIDRGEYKKLEEPSTSFSIDIPFSTMTDNEHTIYVYAVDIHGVKGPVAERKIRVSTEEPRGAVLLPKIESANKGTITLSGVSSDNNGIDKVFVSVDNGSSYNNVIGTEDWSYTFDTHAIPNGTSVVFLKIIDKYGIEALYSSLLNIDNESPEMILDYPLDYSTTTGPLFYSGYAFDNVDITELFVSIRSLDGKSVPRNMQRIDFKRDRIIAQNIDISSLENGSYNIELTALDKAMNATHISRNIRLDKAKPLATVNLLYPLNGEHKQGEFNIYGNAEADKPIEKLSLYIDGAFVDETVLTDSDYFVFHLSADKIASGVHKYRVDALVEGGTVISSRVQTVDYNSAGPWVKIDNFVYGDFAIERPYIIGTAGYSLDGDETEIAKIKMKNVAKEQVNEILEKKLAVASKKVDKIEISFDNGKSFTPVSRGEKWMYRVENQDMPEGYHFMLVRATMKNGETAIERTIIQIDNTSPKIRLISPSQGGRYNQELLFSGLTSDDVGLKNVKLTLRKGDKASYEVPSFIQGLYLDWHFWGATLFDIGVGLTFFDDVVKVQFQWGQFTQAQRDAFSRTEMRYGGDNVMGIKILANIAHIPAAYFFGRDWEWLSADVAIGAQFSRFNETNSGQAQILSAVLAQLEFPKVSFPKMKMFSSFSAYTEFSLWFIPTDVQGAEDVDINNLVPQIAEGIRVSVF